MRRTGLILVVLTALVAAPAAEAGVVAHPTITEHQAEGDAYQFLHRTYPGWRHKRYGYVDCGHGRINRFTWSCGVGWVSGRSNCWQGRLRIENLEYELGTFYYEVKAHTYRRC
jgi:hypothetical protein